MSFLPGLGIAKGMALTLLRFFQPKVTIMYPEATAEGSPKFRGRLQLLYDEWGTLKCETCFQCAQACPIECIDMGGIDTKGRYHIHWGAAETYGERRDESALRRAGRPVPDEAYEHFGTIDLVAVDEILVRHDYDPKEMLQILEETQEAYGYLPVAALKRISFSTGAWYAMLYGTASYYRHLRFDPPIESVAICRCTSCLMSGAGRIQDALEQALDTRIGQASTTGRIRLEQLPSHTPGAASPLVTVNGTVERVTAAGADAWAAGRSPAPRAALGARRTRARPAAGRRPDRVTTFLATPADWPRILLARADAPDPGDLDAAVAAGAFTALRRAIEELGPAATIDAVEQSGLRGRGGAGYPTGAKWRACAGTEAARRFVVANGYGADPATFTDQALMERNPYAVIEGLGIAAYAVGANEAVIAVRADYADAVRGLESAVQQAQDAGFLGADVLDSGFELTVTVRAVQGAYMLGEETVLLKAIEGKRGQPEQRPPHPAVQGLFGSPTVVQNVATLASVPWILREGPGAFAAIGSPAAPGTALVQVSGATAGGIAEVPTGTPLRAIIQLAGGVPAGHTLKALLVGGPSGGLLPPDGLDTPYDYDPLRAAGAHVGSGSIVIADERACTVDLARLLTAFCADEACGKSIPCRIGTRRLAEIGDRFVTGRPMPADLQLLGELSHDIVESALCDHERLTTLPMASGMRYFRAELDDHILRSSCPAGVCHPIAVAIAGAAQ